MPMRASTSAKLMPAARTRMRTSPSPGVGSGRSRSSNTSASPCRVMTACRTADSLPALPLRGVDERGGRLFEPDDDAHGEAHADGVLGGLDAGQLTRTAPNLSRQREPGQSPLPASRVERLMERAE